jgi:ADP-heptose:LPS heptosyltransferase
MTERISRLLIVRADRIGDLMHVTPLLHALHHHQPSLQVDVLAKTPSTFVLEGNPAVGAVLDARWDDVRLSSAITAGRYDAVAHLFPERRLIALCRGIPRSVRKGILPWPGRHRRIILRRSRSLQSEALYNADLLRPWFPGLRVDPRPWIHPSATATARAAELMPSPRPLFNPGSGHPDGAWPAERFAAVARDLAATMGRPLVVWGPGEETLARQVAEAGNAELAPATTLMELAALAGRCAVMVTNDTGPMHIGAAAGAPLVVVWDGSRAIRPRRWGHAFRSDIINFDPYDGSGDEVAERQRRLATIPVAEVIAAAKRIARWQSNT